MKLSAFKETDGRIETGGQQFSVTYEEWGNWNPEGFRFRTFLYNEVDSDFSDGAEIEVRDGGRTPVQAFISDRNKGSQYFWEQPLEGDLTLLYLDLDKQVHVEHITQENLGKKMFVIKPGMVMCWFGGKTSKGISRIRECEYPGFYEPDLQTVQRHSNNIMGLEIPKDFWDTFDKLSSTS